MKHDDERCVALRIRQEAARQRMAKLGIKTLLEGHKGWQTVRPMAAPEAPATVIPMRKRK